MKTDIPVGYVRVTELLAPYSGLQSVDPIVLAKAADRGQRVHDYCELYAQSLLIEEPDEDCKRYVESFKRWFDSVVSDVIGIEERLYDEEYRVTGKYDLLVKMKGSDQVVLVDIKTPQNQSKTWPLQTAAYFWMLNSKQYERVAQRRGCLIVDKNGGDARFMEHTRDIEDRSIFLGILSTYRYFNR